MHYYWIAAFIFGVVSSLIAFSKGRNSLGWFIAGIFIGPFALVVAALPPVAGNAKFSSCVACAEVIRTDATVCYHCGAAVDQLSQAQN